MLKKIGKNRYEIPKTGSMNCPARVYLRGSLKKIVEENSLNQLRDAAEMPGAVAVLGMPDLHVGFGIPIGGVLVMDAEKGLISAGAVGMDINCGVRMLLSEHDARDFDRRDIGKFARKISKYIPTGIGTTSPHKEKLKPYLNDILVEGVPRLVDLGFARKDDLPRLQDGGCFSGASPASLSSRARERIHQLSTLGGGNHFIEIDVVSEIFDQQVAGKFGLKSGQLVVQIHTGSRGFGHQICKDYSNRMKNSASDYGINLPSKGLAAAPIDSDLGHSYFEAMACAANFAYANRQIITHDVRRAFNEFVPEGQSAKLELLYDIAHNLARFEEIDNKNLLIHRKGAIRALPASHPESPEAFSETGHPLLIPGTMGTDSYVATATEETAELYYSVNHGAGRTKSRRQAKQEMSVQSLRQTMKDIPIFGASEGKVLDEAPQAYKDIDEVVETLAEINLSKKIARVSPLAVIKGN